MAFKNTQYYLVELKTLWTVGFITENISSSQRQGERLVH